MPKPIPKEHEHLYARHVRLHTQQARFDVEKALEAVPPHLTLHQELTEALKHVYAALTIAERWYSDVTATEPGLFGGDDGQEEEREVVAS